MKAKKSLGQNFLKSEEALSAIISAADLKKTDTVLEIGPGMGVLTTELLKKAGRVIAVEKDERLVAHLSHIFSDQSYLDLISEDILTFEPKRHGLSDGSFKIIANIPYYITGEILRKFLSGPVQPSMAVLLVQKEVAERIVAEDGHHSLLSLSVHAYGTPSIVAHVPRTAFDPAPDVDSAIILIKNIGRDYFKTTDETAFFKALHLGFSHKRKLVASNLGDQGRELLATCGIAPLSRAENLSLSDWACISQKMA